jgi:hypothetical protein
MTDQYFQGFANSIVNSEANSSSLLKPTQPGKITYATRLNLELLLF